MPAACCVLRACMLACKFQVAPRPLCPTQRRHQTGKRDTYPVHAFLRWPDLPRWGAGAARDAAWIALESAPFIFSESNDPKGGW